MNKDFENFQIPTINEVDEIIKHLPNGKASGDDGIKKNYWNMADNQ